jgi:hypothetical protein
MRIDHAASALAPVGSIHRTVLLAALAAITSGTAIAHVVRHNSIPDTYVGRWAPGTETCKESDKAVIVLSAKKYVSPEAECAVDWVSETPGPHGPIFSAHLRCAGPAAQTQKTAGSNIIIRPDNDRQISIGSDFDNLKPYRRCSANEPAATR